MSPYAKFGLDRPSRSAGHRQDGNRQTDKQTNKRTNIAFYMLDTYVVWSWCGWWWWWWCYYCKC